MSEKIKVLIAVGGTGGHVFPGCNLGLHLIEKKRNSVRYKYGQQLKFTHKPSLYFSNNFNGLGMELILNLF